MELLSDEEINKEIESAIADYAVHLDREIIEDRLTRFGLTPQYAREIANKAWNELG